MGMVTRCPACSTLFRVTPQQLQAHRGQVRCGACRHVFNGFHALEAEPEPHTAQSPQLAPSHEIESHGLPEIVVPETVPTLFPFVDVVAPGMPQVPRPYAWSPRRADIPVVVAPPRPLEAEAPVTEVDIAGEAATTPVETPAWTSSVTLPGRVSEAVGSAEPLPATPVDGSPTKPAPGDTPDLHPDGESAEPHVRRVWPWALSSLLLVAMAAAQGVQEFGAQIVARQPVLRPALQRACGVIRCDLSLPQRPKLINIEASDLQAIDPARPGLIQLTATLRNHAGYEVAYPAVDLVLTNTRDHTLARRIFLPTDYLAKGKDVSAGISGNAEFTVRLDLDTGDLAASGFRLDILPAPSH